MNARPNVKIDLSDVLNIVTDKDGSKEGKAGTKIKVYTEANKDSNRERPRQRAVKF